MFVFSFYFIILHYNFTQRILSKIRWQKYTKILATQLHSNLQTDFCNQVANSNKIITELSHVVQERAEGPKAPSPGHRPGDNSNQQGALKGQKLCIFAQYFKAFALTGRQACVHNYPGRCPGLGASALSGRVELTCET